MRFNLLFTLLLWGCWLAAQNFDSLSRHVDFALKNIAAYHYSPPTFGNTEKAEVLDLFVKEADVRRILLLETDRKILSDILQSAESNEVYDAFVRKAVSIFQTRARQGDSILTKLESKPLEFNTSDTVIFFPGNQKRVLSANLKVLARRLHRLVKYDCLSQLVETKADNTTEPATAQTAQAKSAKRLRHYYARYSQPRATGEFITDCLCNALANRCDPHSSFFNIRQMDDFNRSLSMSELSFGFEMGEDDAENVVISELVPGGPAWKSNNLSENDILVSYRLGNGKEIHVAPGDLNSVYDDFSKSTARQVELKVRKKDLKIQSLKLNKEKIQSEENRMNSYVVNYQSTKMGYIPIPSFYLDDEEDSRQGCANDVAKEIIELKQDSVQGLIRTCVTMAADRCAKRWAWPAYLLTKDLWLCTGHARAALC